MNNYLSAEGWYTIPHTCPKCQKVIPAFQTVYSHESKTAGILDYTICQDCHDKIMKS